MLLVSSTLGDTLSFERARDHALKHWLSELPQPPRWADGSGLSRYNQFSPESVVFLLQKMYAEIPEARLFALMAQGGQPGTLRTWFRDPQGAYLFGKTGSLSGVQNLSGYLKTRSGKTVVFSFMNNHFTGPGRLVRARMERMLEWVRENY
jgi:D-alanyl-D-alanine carboxypeptidase/D-alanyl-D-alanine-endopeptidase (penicillin-binding protein 4)